MDIEIKIKQIDNGFILSLFDADGPTDYDEELFFTHFAVLMKKIKDWTKVKA